MQTPGRVYVVGALNHDLLLSVANLPADGETVVALRERTAPGGKGANQAVAAARAGVPTTMVGAVGTDESGDELLRQLAAFEVEVDQILWTPSPTGSAIVLVDSRGANQIVVRPGANADLTVGHVTAGLANVVPADVVVVQCEVAVDVVTAAVRAGHAAGATVVLNWAPVIPLPADLVATTSVVVVNQAEAAALADRPDAPADELAENLQRRFGGAVLVTLGAAGSVAATPRGTVRVPSVPASAVLDTTGAGDSYVGTLAAALAAPPADLPDAMAVAAAAASRTVEHSGAQPSQPDPDLTISAPR